MNILELLLGQIPEAIFFTVFMIFVKEYNKRRILFVTSMVVEYVLLLYAFPYNIWSHVLFFIVAYIIMKSLYKNECNITDVFTLSIASIILMVSSVICFILCNGNTVIATVINRILLFLLLIIFKNKLPKIKQIYNFYWNRNNKPKKIKATTFRALNLVIFNCSFVIMNVCAIIAIIYNHKAYY